MFGKAHVSLNMSGTTSTSAPSPFNTLADYAQSTAQPMASKPMIRLHRWVRQGTVAAG